MATRKKLNREVVAKAVHTQNRQGLKPIGADEGISFEGLEQEKLCEVCGETLEKNLWGNWECGFCIGYRERKTKADSRNANLRAYGRR
jgi:hypothetical protein